MTDKAKTVLARWAQDPRRLAIVVVVSALVAFLPSLTAGFVYDDHTLITENPYAQSWTHLARCFSVDLFDTPARASSEGRPLFYRPLVCVSYIVDWQLFSGRAWGFHLVNTLAHAAACALAFVMASRWTGHPLGGLIAALAFAVHPTRSESVVWVSGRTDVFMGLFLLLALNAAATAATSRGPRAAFGWIGVAAAWCAAVLSKEYALAFPVLLGVEAWLARRRDAPRRAQRLAIATAATAAAAIAYLAARASFMPILPSDVSAMSLGAPLRAAYAALTTGYYAARVIAPWPQTLQYEPIELANGVPVLPPIAVAAGAVVAALWVVWAWRARRAPSGAQAAAALILCLPILNVWYTGFRGTTADRFTYVPLLLVATALVSHGAEPIVRWLTRARLAPTVVAAVALASSAVSWVRTLDYASEHALWTHEVSVHPDNPHALAKLAEAESALGNGHVAFELLRRALAPQSLAHALVADPPRYYVALLQLHGERLADGNVEALEALLSAQRDLVGGRIPTDPIRTADLTLPPLRDPNAARTFSEVTPAVAASAALIASRLGRDDVVAQMAALVTDTAPLKLASRYNLALALARAGDFRSARHQLGIGTLAYPDARLRMEAARQRFERIASLRDGRPEAEARAQIELGAYLRTVRILDDAPVTRSDGRVGRLYVEALVAARLRDEARRAAQRVAPTGYRRLLADLESQLSPRTARAIGPPTREPR